MAFRDMINTIGDVQDILHNWNFSWEESLFPFQVPFLSKQSTKKRRNFPSFHFGTYLCIIIFLPYDTWNQCSFFYFGNGNLHFKISISITPSSTSKENIFVLFLHLSNKCNLQTRGLLNIIFAKYQIPTFLPQHLPSYSILCIVYWKLGCCSDNRQLFQHPVV